MLKDEMRGAAMMSEPKPFASLSSGLLARKGHARPAMRPQGFTGGYAFEPTFDGTYILLKQIDGRFVAVYCGQGQRP